MENIEYIECKQDCLAPDIAGRDVTALDKDRAEEYINQESQDLGNRLSTLPFDLRRVDI